MSPTPQPIHSTRTPHIHSSLLSSAEGQPRIPSWKRQEGGKPSQETLATHIHMIPPENTTMCRLEGGIFQDKSHLGALCSLPLFPWNAVLCGRVGLCAWSAATPHQPIPASSDSRMSVSDLCSLSETNLLAQETKHHHREGGTEHSLTTLSACKG